MNLLEALGIFYFVLMTALIAGIAGIALWHIGGCAVTLIRGPRD